MRSGYVRVEPASQHPILLIGDIVLIEEDDIAATGAHFPLFPPWKPSRTIEVTGTERYVTLLGKIVDIECLGETQNPGVPTTIVKATWTNTFADSIAKHVQDKFSAIPGVEQVYARRDSDFYRVWTVVPEMNRDLEDQICEAELASMDRFPGIRFDFTVIFRQGKDPASIRPSGAFLIHG